MLYDDVVKFTLPQFSAWLCHFLRGSPSLGVWGGAFLAEIYLECLLSPFPVCLGRVRAQKEEKKDATVWDGRICSSSPAWAGAIGKTSSIPGKTLEVTCNRKVCKYFSGPL